jgi:PAS domain-containing protein
LPDVGSQDGARLPQSRTQRRDQIDLRRGARLARLAGALNGLADAVKASAAQFGSYNAATHSLQTVMPRIDPDYATSFVEHWASRNTVWQQSSVVPVGQVMRPEMFFAPGGWRRTDFFNEWYRPQRLDSLIGTNLLVEGPVSTVVSVLRKEPFARAEIELFTLLIPHVQRAVQLQLRLAVLEDKQSGSAEVLNRLPQGVLLVDAAGKVRFANRAAEGMLADGAGLRVAGGVVQAARTDETCILRKARWQGNCRTRHVWKLYTVGELPQRTAWNRCCA